MIKIRFFILFILLLLFTEIPGFSQELRRNGNSFRSLGMGGTGITTASDTKALAYNPATLANIQQSFWDILALTVELNKDGYNLSKFLYDRDSEEGSFGDSTADYFDFLNKYKGKNIHLYARAESAYYGYLLDRGFVWGINFAVEGDYNFEIDDSINITSNVFLRADQVIEGGLSIPFGLGAYVLGLGVRSIERVEYSLTYSLTDLTTDKRVPNLNGLPAIRSNGYDIGFMYRMPHPSRFKFGIVGKNLGGITFEKDGTEYTKINQEISAGISISPVVNRWTYKFALDVRDLTFEFFDKDDDKDLIKRTHLGLEVGYIPINRTFNLFALRAGLNQGYPTFGVEGNFGFQKNLILGYTFYSVEKGKKAGDDQDERNIFYLSLGF